MGREEGLVPMSWNMGFKKRKINNLTDREVTLLLLEAYHLGGTRKIVCLLGLEDHLSKLMISHQPYSVFCVLL